MQPVNIKLILFIIFLLACLAMLLSSVRRFQQIKQEVEQIKKYNEERIGVITALKQTYDEKRYDEKSANLEQQVRTLASQSG